MKSFSLQESNADLPSEYWQIQKLVKYLKVCIVLCGNFLRLFGGEEVILASYSFVASRLPCRGIKGKAKFNYILTFPLIIDD